MDWLHEEVSFQNLRSYGGVMVSAVWTNGKTVKVELRIPRKMLVCIKNTFGVSDVKLLKNGKVQTLSDENGYFRIDGKRGTVTLTI